MDTEKLLMWLMSDKKMSKRSAKDVLSRCGRVYRILGTDRLDDTSVVKLQDTSEFKESSMFVKSQLKRTITLCLEFMKVAEQEET